MSQQNNTLEKTIFFIGILVLVALVGYLTLEIIKKEKGPPSLNIRSQYDPSLKKYGFKVEVENTGHETAESANIEFELYQQGKVEAQAVLEIDYVPVRSKEVGWVVFSMPRKPGDSLVVRSVSYLQP